MISNLREHNSSNINYKNSWSNWYILYTEVRRINTWWWRRSPVLLLQLPLPSQTTSAYSLEQATNTQTYIHIPRLMQNNTDIQTVHISRSHHQTWWLKYYHSLQKRWSRVGVKSRTETQGLVVMVQLSLTIGAPLCPINVGVGPRIPASLMQGEYIPRGTR